MRHRWISAAALAGLLATQGALGRDPVRAIPGRGQATAEIGIQPAQPNAAPSALAVAPLTADSNVDRVRGTPGASTTVEIDATNVRVEGQFYLQYRMVLQAAFPLPGAPVQVTLTEMGNGIPLSMKPLGPQFDLRLVSFGGPGLFLDPTGNPQDLRAVDSPAGPLQISVRTRVVADPAQPGVRLDDGSGPHRTWEKLVVSTGFPADLGRSVVESANDASYFNATETESLPLVDVVRVQVRYQEGTTPLVLHQNGAQRGPRGVVNGARRGLAEVLEDTLPGRALDVYDGFASVHDNLVMLQDLEADVDDSRIKFMGRTVIAMKIYLLFTCIYHGGIKGSMNADAFDQCVYQVDDFSEGIDETPGPCENICGAPDFDIGRCDPDVANSFDDIDVIDELCDVYRDLRDGVEGEDTSAGADKVLDEMESKMESTMELVWGEMKAYCSCT